MRILLAIVMAVALAAPAAAGIRLGRAPAPQCHDFRDDVGRMHTVCIDEADFFGGVCDAIATYAWAHGLPPAYFARVIWQESRFDPNAVSHAGAEGIAQFMPATAALRGLPNSFQPAQALAYSAEYLSFLESRFGNLGLAAAAYNAGEGRVSRWLRNGGSLPGETRAYVQIVTGQPVEAWQAGLVADLDYALSTDNPFREACIAMAEARPVPTLTGVDGIWKPWGVLLAQNFSRDVVVNRFERVSATYASLLGDEAPLMLTVRNPSFGRKLRHSAMIGRDTRADAEALCAELRRLGGSCVVVRN